MTDLNQKQLPSYRETINQNLPSSPPTYSESESMGTSHPYDKAQVDGIPKQNLCMTNLGAVGSSEHGETVLRMKGVQVFHVSASGEVSTPSYPEVLHLVKFDRQKNRSGEQLPSALIEVGEWTYPLVRGQSPVLKAEHGSYMFPDLKSDITGGAVGIIIPDTVTENDRDIFDNLLAEIATAFKTQEEVPAENEAAREMSSTLTSGLVKGAEAVGLGMVEGAMKTSEYLSYGSEYAKQYITPEATEVDPRVKQGLEAASWFGAGAFSASSWMLSKVSSATMALGTLAAPHLERGATQALSSLTNQSNAEASSQVEIAGEVAAGTASAMSTMYQALETSSKILATNIASNTVSIVSHKYGTEVDAVKDAAIAGPEGICKSTVEDPN
eukprot:GFUD01025866.1.p1 GENE.GFUD01025866.1~~GFUD01025866.1.p1  ORF type:complete len:384 (+),score=122.26 GFUD01025866.1:39-1190(+)